MPSGSVISGSVTAPAAWVGGPGGGQQALEAAEIALADANGDPIAGLVHQRTDAEGRYAMAGAPPGYSYVVTARYYTPDGREVTLQTLTRDGEAPIDLGTTLVTQLATEGARGAVGNVDEATFKQAVDAMNQHLATGPIPVDPTAALQQAKAWLQQDATLNTAVGTLKQQAAAGNATQRDADISRTRDRDPLDALSPVY
jgi:hypothetical protein